MKKSDTRSKKNVSVFQQTRSKNKREKKKKSKNQGDVKTYVRVDERMADSLPKANMKTAVSLAPKFKFLLIIAYLPDPLENFRYLS